MVSVIVILAILQDALAPNLQVRADHERRGAMLAYLDGLPAESPAACASTCALNDSCQAWTWRASEQTRPARCELLSHVAAPTPRPGAVTGLSASLAGRINAAMDRPLSARERAAVDAASQSSPSSSATPSSASPIGTREPELAGG